MFVVRQLSDLNLQHLGYKIFRFQAKVDQIKRRICIRKLSGSNCIAQCLSKRNLRNTILFENLQLTPRITSYDFKEDTQFWTYNKLLLACGFALIFVDCSQNMNGKVRFVLMLSL